MTKVDTKMVDSTLAARAFYAFGRTVCIAFCRVWTRLTGEGIEHVPTSGPYLLAPVHRSNMDILFVAICTKRRLRYMGKDSLWKNKVFAWLLSTLGGFPVSRDIADREALERCISVLAGGEPLVLYPEGERKSGPIVQPLKEGAAYIALRAGVPIVPVGIGGSERVMPKGGKMIYPRKVHVVVGPPITVPPSASGRITKSQRAAMTEQLHATLQELFDRAEAKVAGR